MEVDTRKYVAKSLRLMDQVVEVLRFHHYAFNTEKSYVSWILQYIRFHNKKHPKDMGKLEAEAFLSHLASKAKQMPIEAAKGQSREKQDPTPAIPTSTISNIGLR